MKEETGSWVVFTSARQAEVGRRMRAPGETRIHTVLAIKKRDGERCIIFGVHGSILSVPVTMAKKEKWLIEVSPHPPYRGGLEGDRGAGAAAPPGGGREAHEERL